MSLSVETPIEKKAYVGPGDYTYNFTVYDDDEILVTHIDATTGARTTLVKTTDYTVDLNEDYKGGIITTTYATVNGWIEFALSVPYNQPVVYSAAGGLNLVALESMVDKVVQRMQLLDYVINHNLDIPSFRGDWATTTAYAEGDLVVDVTTNIGMYVCKIAHTSGTWATDVTSGKWEIAFSQNDVAAFADLPTFGAGDAYKTVRVNSAHSSYELAHHVPDPSTATEGTVPCVTQPTAGTFQYTELEMALSATPRLKFEYASANSVKITGRAMYFIDPNSDGDIAGPITCVDTGGTAYTLTGISGTSYWHYIYINASSLTDRTFDHSNLRDSVNTPLITNWGWGSSIPEYDPCIFAVWIDGSGNISPFYHDGGDMVTRDSQTTLRSYAALGTGWQTIDANIALPYFSREFIAQFLCGDATNTAHYYQRVNGSTGSGNYITSTASSQVFGTNASRIVTSGSRYFQVQSNQTTSSMGIFCTGFFLPRGL